MELAEKIRLTVDEIKELYLDSSDPKPWAVAWSGGKDSTTVMRMVAQALMEIAPEQRTRKIYGVMSDTKMENPELERYMHDQVGKLNEWAEANDMPLEVHVVSREDKRSFWFTVLGKGYYLPTRVNRWCTHTLKIEPQNDFIKSVAPSLVLLGVRTDESIDRAASIRQYRDSAESRFGTHYNLKDLRTYMPIVDYTTEEVWEILSAPLPWSSSLDIRRLYREATGECALVAPGKAVEAKDACGARFGCWSCPAVTNDRSTETMALTHEWLQPLADFRKELLFEWEKNLTNRCGYMRNGKYLGEGKGNRSISARRRLMARLLETEAQVNAIRSESDLEPIRLISDLEIEMIYAQWREDVSVRPWTIGGDVA